jgi:hypothetical protein
MYLIFVPILRFSQAVNIVVMLRTPCLSDAIYECAPFWTVQHFLHLLQSQMQIWLYCWPDYSVRKAMLQLRFHYSSWVQQISHCHTKHRGRVCIQLASYAEDQGFLYRPKNSLSWPTFLYFYLACPVKYRHRTFNNATAASFHIITNSLIPNPTIRRRILKATSTKIIVKLTRTPLANFRKRSNVDL